MRYEITILDNDGGGSVLFKVYSNQIYLTKLTADSVAITVVDYYRDRDVIRRLRAGEQVPDV